MFSYECILNEGIYPPDIDWTSYIIFRITLFSCTREELSYIRRKYTSFLTCIEYSFSSFKRQRNVFRTVSLGSRLRIFLQFNMHGMTWSTSASLAPRYSVSDDWVKFQELRMEVKQDELKRGHSESSLVGKASRVSGNSWFSSVQVQGNIYINLSLSVAIWVTALAIKNWQEDVIWKIMKTISEFPDWCLINCMRI